jgi:hypothetical protein
MTIVNYLDYHGYYYLEEWEVIKDLADLGDWIAEQLEDPDVDDQDIPNLIPVAEPCNQINLDLRELLLAECERNDWQDEHIERLTLDDHPFLHQAQELINKWQEEHKGLLCLYEESRSISVDISLLIEKIKQELLK